jgi:hypothetical protein
VPNTYRGTANIEAQSSTHLYKVLAGQVNPKAKGQASAEPCMQRHHLLTLLINEYPLAIANTNHFSAM